MPRRFDNRFDAQHHGASRRNSAGKYSPANEAASSFKSGLRKGRYTKESMMNCPKISPAMARENSRDRYIRVAAAAATILFALTVGAAAQSHGHGGHGYTPPPVKSSYDPAKSVVRDHRTPPGSGASAIPAGTPRK
jgi:hypothetical protein